LLAGVVVLESESSLLGFAALSPTGSACRRGYSAAAAGAFVLGIDALAMARSGHLTAA
jgi:hypothetical protein